MKIRDDDRPKGKRGAGYIRVSREKNTGGKSDEKTSPEAQKMVITAWCIKHKVPVPTVWYMDVEGKNSRDNWLSREQFEKMIQAAEAGEHDFIIVDSQERFGAGQKAFNYYLYRLELAGCELWSVADNCNLCNEDDGTVFKVAVGNQTGTRELLNDGRRQVSRKRILAALGEWQGGYVPYGADVICVGPDRKEKFRVVILKMIPKEDVYYRVRVWPDGRQERFDGEGVFPVKEQHDKFFLAPSIIGERVETARDIFDLFASGAWTQRGLCKRLNQRSVDPVYGHGWYASRLGPMLRNPFFHIGQTVWGKKSHGKNAWYTAGEYVIPPKVKGRPLPRKNDISDWVFPNENAAIPTFSIVDKKTWDEVQTKLEPGNPRKRGLRDANLWLSGLVRCGRCGEPMDGWTLKPDKNCPYSYVCRTFRKYGHTPANKTGCRLHRVNQTLIECFVQKYLDDIGPQVKMMLDSREDPSLVREIHKRLSEKEGELFDVFREMKKYVEAHEIIVNAKGIDEVNGIIDLYSCLFERDRQGIADELKKKEEELEALFAKFETLPKTATILQEKVTARLVAVEEEVRGLRAKLTPLTSRLEAVYADLARLDANLDEARNSLPGDNNRLRAEALRKVVKEIRLHFRHYEHICRDRRAKSQTKPKSALESVEFIPVVGEPATLIVNSGGGKDSQAATPDASLRNVQPEGAKLMMVRPAGRI